MNTRIRYSIILLWAIIVFCVVVGLAHAGSVEVYFSPHGGATDAVCREIASAQREVLVQAYSFTSAPIAQALTAAKKCGVSVTVILDKSQVAEKYSSADYLVHSGINTYIDRRHAIAHNKIIIIDRQTIITGSFNFTKAAEDHNAENLLILRGYSELSTKYMYNFDDHLSHSEEYNIGGR